jgi:outer membrane scaffolding protein for murein synthesis (MipA/OmpV family)
MPPISQALVLITTAAVFSVSAQAQSNPNASSWEISAGPALISVPKYLGSKERRNLLVPFVELNGPNGLFFDIERGFGQELKLGDSTRFSYSLALDLTSRRSSDDVRFKKLTDINDAAAARVEFKEDLDRFAFVAAAQTRLAKSAEAGSNLSLEGSYQLTQSREFLLSAGLNAKFMDKRFARNFLGVSADQAAASGLSQYAPRAGLYRVAPFLQVLAKINDDWTAFARVEAGSLRGDADRSPLVRQTRGDVVVLAVSRVF